MKQIFSVENLEDGFIKGSSLEFGVPLKIDNTYSRNYIYSMEDFLNDEFILPRIRGAGITHLFLHLYFYDDENNRNHLTLKSHGEQNDENVNSNLDWEDDFLEKWRDIIIKVKNSEIVPVIKIMNDNYEFDSLLIAENADIFFEDYLRLTKKILEQDKDTHYIEILTIANETHLIRDYMGLKQYWEDYIKAVKEERADIKISMSQFAGDIVNGVCDIVDLVDIIGINYYPAVPGVIIPGVEDVISNIYNNDIYVIQEYCRMHNVKFMITEYGCSCWRGQAREPEQGNSMALYNNEDIEMHNYLVQASYLQGGCIGFPLIKECIGLSILGLGKGSNYDWAYKCAIDTNSAKENIISYNAVKAVWKLNTAVYDEINKIWVEEEDKKYLIEEVIEGGEFNE